MNRTYKKLLIAFATFIGGLYFFLEFLLPESIQGFRFGASHEEITKGLQTISAMALGLGIVNILTFHGGKIIRTREGWFNSAALLIGLIITLWIQGFDIIISERNLLKRQQLETLAVFATTIEKDFVTKQIAPLARMNSLMVTLLVLNEELSNQFQSQGEQTVVKTEQLLFERFRVAAEKARDLKATYLQLLSLPPNADKPPKVLELATTEFVKAAKALATAAQEMTTTSYEKGFFPKASHFLEVAFFNSLGAAMFSLLAFYIANAAYRSFRIRSFEALVMMMAALIVMLGQIPHGPLYISSSLPHWRLWLLRQISTPAFRAIYFGSAIAGLAMAVRMWLSMEQSPLSGKDGEEKNGKS